MKELFARIYALRWMRGSPAQILPASRTHTCGHEGAKPTASPGELAGSDVQWHRIAGIVEGRIDAARLVADRQYKALTQLDAAEFALAKIVEDLSAIMPLAHRRNVPAQQSVHGARPALAA